MRTSNLLALSTPMDDAYQIVGGLVGLLVFIAGYIYAIVEYGFLLGGSLGWIPALIVAAISAMLWPVFAILILALYFYLKSGSI